MFIKFEKKTLLMDNNSLIIQTSLYVNGLKNVDPSVISYRIILREESSYASSRAMNKRN